MMTKNPRQDESKDKMLFTEGINENVKLVMENDKLTNKLTHKSPLYNSHSKENKYKNSYNSYKDKSKNYNPRYRGSNYDPDYWKKKKSYKHSDKYDKKKYKGRKKASSPKKGGGSTAPGNSRGKPSPAGKIQKLGKV